MARIYVGMVHARYWWKFHAVDRQGAKAAKSGFRSWLAWSFRWLADSLDGTRSVSFDLNSTPSLSETEKRAVINRGLSHANRLFVDLVERESLDEAMREARPDLYREDVK